MKLLFSFQIASDFLHVLYKIYPKQKLNTLGHHIVTVSSLKSGVTSFCLCRSLYPQWLKLIMVFCAALIFLLRLALNHRILLSVLVCPYLRELRWLLSLMRSGVSQFWELIEVGWPKFWRFISWLFLKWTHISSLQREGGDWGREFHNQLPSFWMFLTHCASSMDRTSKAQLLV